MAIVELQNDIYLARMFFGDPETGTVLWDLDCRPSDATFLALRVRGTGLRQSKNRRGGFTDEKGWQGQKGP